MERVDEMTSPPIIGRRYWVSCIFVPSGGIGHSSYGWWPLNGRPHDDADIGVPEEHYHFDARFLSHRQFINRVEFWKRRIATEGLPTCPLEKAVLASILPLHSQGADAPPLHQAYRRLTCRRAMPTFPRELIQASWLPRLEDSYANAVAKGCRTCPHRGLPLASLPADERGVVTCAGHGLQWDKATGVLVRERRVSP